MEKSLMIRVLFLFLFALSFVSCKTTSTVGKNATYAMKAQQMYSEAKKLHNNSNFEEARKLFEKVKSKFPYSRYSILSEIGIADTFFAAEKYLQAIDRYQLFIKLHPSHEQNGYATFQVAHSHYKLRPWNFIILPPRYEKDASTTRQAIASFKRFLYLYPSHALVPDAQKKLKECTLQMAKHEMHVSQFYERKKRYQAIAWRMEFLLKNYPKTALQEEAKYRLGWAYTQMKEYTKAEKTLQELLAENQKGKWGTKAQKQLNQIKSLVQKQSAAQKGKK